ncbi:YqaJ viral recombinase family protein [Azospirillum doebereinerae]|uniref:YqaJ viral recombinase family protein n=1 Tax=Azospirillum doebereinerae TaxID=92933 RepID=UPI001EE60BF4|nr:YqaJ viral recombinase family protein [Azospirillum doebereinerae]MCG5238534.1 YqaJ viral recombinase family protein [Azospirillum doebereinerae]
MAITDAQRALRAGRIGSSDATRVMAGDWLALWREKTGRVERDNLDLVAAVQIGIATEHLHPRFVEHATGLACVAAPDSFFHAEHDWMVAHPDFLARSAADGELDTVVEAKFNSGFQTDTDLARRYHWQLQHQLAVMGLERGLLSILRPTGHAMVAVPRRADDVEHLIETLEAFWWHVVNDVEPSDPLPVEGPSYETRRVLDMSRHNRFRALAEALLDRRAATLEAREAEASIKALMPDDARVAFVGADEPGRGLYLTRDRDGRLSLRYGAPPRRALGDAQHWAPSADPSLEAVLTEGWTAGWGEGSANTTGQEGRDQWDA